MHMTEPVNQKTRPAPPRPYRMGRRLETVEQTRQRIVAATFELHAAIGPSRTSIKAIADRAGVQRHTVYAHFPELDTLYEACTTHGMTITAMPHPDDWAGGGDPGDRLRHGLSAMVAWYRANTVMLANVLFDVDPAAPPPTSADPFEVRFGALVARLHEGWTVPPERRQVFDAVLMHALAYTTWRSLADAGLPDDRIVDVLVGLVHAVADGTIPEPSDRPTRSPGRTARRSAGSRRGARPA
jgi:AcrR family transcriptional regulator